MRSAAYPARGCARRIGAGDPALRQAQQADTSEQGVYCFEQHYADGDTRSVYFTVHGDAAEYDVRSVGASGGEGLSRQLETAAGHELTLWVLLAFLALLLIEWGVSRRVA